MGTTHLTIVFIASSCKLGEMKTFTSTVKAIPVKCQNTVFMKSKKTSN